MKIIGSNSSKKATELWGQEFDVVKEGLSESQVVAFVTELFDENKTLAKKVERLDFMEKLAEKTMREADELAASIREQAEEEATSILQKTKEDAAEIRINAEKEISQLLTISREKLENKLTQKADEVYQGILERLQGTIAEVWAMEPVLEAITEEPAQPPFSVPAPDAEIREPVTVESTSVSFEGKVDVLIMPPVDLAQFMKFRKELQCLPKLKILQITSSQKRGSTISTLLDEPIPLLDMLNSMPEVRESMAEANTEAEDTIGWPEAEHNSKRITVKLGLAEQG